MKITKQDYNKVTVIELQGELETDFVELFKEQIVAVVKMNRRGIVVDLSSVGFIDSAGLETLLWMRDYCNDNNCQVHFAGLDENSKKIFEITRLLQEFEIFDELTEAVKSFA